MIYGGPGFFAAVWLGSFPPHHPPPSPFSNVSLFLNLPMCCRRAYWRERREEGAVEEPNHTTARKPEIAKGRKALPLRSFPVVLSAQHIWFCRYPRGFFIFFFTGRGETFKGWTCCTDTVVLSQNFFLSLWAYVREKMFNSAPSPRQQWTLKFKGTVPAKILKI